MTAHDDDDDDELSQTTTAADGVKCSCTRSVVANRHAIALTHIVLR